MVQVQRINNSKYFDEVIPNLKKANYIITQNINLAEKDPFEKIIPYIDKKTKVIFIDSLYSSFYNPELIKTNIIPVFKTGILHDINILKAYIEKVSLSDFLNSDPFYNIYFYDAKKYNLLIKNTIDELKSREKLLKTKIDNNNFKHINILPYILDNYKNNSIALWADFNHPKLPVYKYLIQNIAEEMSMPFDDQLFEKQFNVQTFQNINRPSYASTINYFNILYNEKNTLYNLGKSYINKTREEYVKDVYDFYSLISDEKMLIVYKQIKKQT